MLFVDPGSTSKPRILVVEDNAENQRLISAMLSPLGFDIRMADNGALGLEAFNSWSPNLILMDMHMPVMDGYQATRRIRHANAEIPIIAVTAVAFEQDRAPILEAGCNDILHKPFREPDLLDLLKRFLHLEYVYDDPRPLEQPAPLTDLGNLETTMLDALEKAAISGNRADALAIVESIREEHDTIATGLERLIGDFDFERILLLVDDARKVS